MVAKHRSDSPINLRKVTIVLKISMGFGKCVVEMLNQTRALLHSRLYDKDSLNFIRNQIGKQTFLETKAMFYNILFSDVSCLICF